MNKQVKQACKAVTAQRNSLRLYFSSVIPKSHDAKICKPKKRVRIQSELTYLNNLVVIVMSGEYQRRDIWRELRLLVRPEERILLRPPVQFGAGNVVRMFNDHFDDLRRTLADRVQQRLLDAREADLLHQQLDELHGLAVDGQMQGAPAHVVDAVRVQRRAAVFERLSDDGNVAKCCGIQEDPLFVGQLNTCRATDARTTMIN